MGVIRKTKSLALLLSEFNDNCEAISVIDLVERFKEQLNKSTIYRILDRLEDDGVVHSFLGVKGIKWYAKCKSTCSHQHHKDIHPHFQCTQCGKVECLEVPVSLPKIQSKEVSFVHMMIQGRCEKCMAYK